MGRSVRTLSSGVEDHENRSMVAAEHGEVVDRRPRVRRAPFYIHKVAVEAKKVGVVLKRLLVQV